MKRVPILNNHDIGGIPLGYMEFDPDRFPTDFYTIAPGVLVHSDGRRELLEVSVVIDAKNTIVKPKEKLPQPRAVINSIHELQP